MANKTVAHCGSSQIDDPLLTSRQWHLSAEAAVSNAHRWLRGFQSERTKEIILV